MSFSVRNARWSWGEDRNPIGRFMPDTLTGTRQRRNTIKKTSWTRRNWWAFHGENRSGFFSILYSYRGLDFLKLFSFTYFHKLRFTATSTENCYLILPRARLSKDQDYSDISEKLCIGPYGRVKLSNKQTYEWQINSSGASLKNWRRIWKF